jgi:hypothetical protein
VRKWLCLKCSCSVTKRKFVAVTCSVSTSWPVTRTWCNEMWRRLTSTPDTGVQRLRNESCTSRSWKCEQGELAQDEVKWRDVMKLWIPWKQDSTWPIACVPRVQGGHRGTASFILCLVVQPEVHKHQCPSRSSSSSSNGCFIGGFPSKILCAYLVSPIRVQRTVTFSFQYPNDTKLYTNHEVLRFPAYFVPLRSKHFSRHLFPVAFSLCSSLTAIQNWRIK